MRNAVTIDGVKLTRAQVERAMKALEEPRVEVGMFGRQKDNKTRMVVIATHENYRGWAHRLMEDGLRREGCDYVLPKGFIRTTDGRTTWTFKADKFVPEPSGTGDASE